MMITTTYQDPNQTLATRRQELGLTPAELGAQVGCADSIAASTIQLIEIDRARIPLQKCRQFAAALGVDEAWFTLCLLRKHFPEAADALESRMTQQHSES